MTDWLTSGASCSPGKSTVTSMPGVVEIRVYRGDSLICPFTFYKTYIEAPEMPPEIMPMSGTWRAQIRAAAEDPAVIDSFQVDSALQAEGVIRMLLTPVQTKALPKKTVWDLENVSEDPNTGTHTWLVGTLIISGDITR